MPSADSRGPEMADLAWEQLTVGMKVEENYEISEKVYQSFLLGSADTNPIHVDDGEARRRGFPKKVTHGGILHGFISHFVGMRLPGRRGLLLKTDLRYLLPCHLEDRLKLIGLVSHKSEAAQVLTLDLRMIRESKQEMVAAGQCMVKVQS